MMDHEPRRAQPPGPIRDSLAAVAIVLLAMLLVALVISQAVL